jgi:hypothetical protein
MEVFEEFATPPLPTIFTYFGDTKELVVEYSGESPARVFLDVPPEVYNVTLSKDNKRRNKDWLNMQDKFASISLEEWTNGTE